MDDDWQDEIVWKPGERIAADDQPPQGDTGAGIRTNGSSVSFEPTRLETRGSTGDAGASPTNSMNGSLEFGLSDI